MTDTPKWIQVPAGRRLAKVAHQALTGRLRAVEYYLPRAVKRWQQDTEHVHQLRVWCRRAQAALNIYEPLLPKRAARRLKAQLKRIRRATNEARDDDVFIQSLLTIEQTSDVGDLLERVREHRAQVAQQVVAKAVDRIVRKEQFEKRVDKLLQRVRRRTLHGGKNPKYGKWAKSQLPQLVDRFLQSGRAELSDESKLHAFRLEAKRLKYALELLAPALGQDVGTQVERLLSTIQNQLGAINDHFAASTRLAAWRSQSNSSLQGLLAELEASERKEFDIKREAFCAGWRQGGERQFAEVFNAGID